MGGLQSTFMDNWLETRGEVLQSDGYFPALAPWAMVWLEAWRDRGLRQRLRERLAGLLAPQL